MRVSIFKFCITAHDLHAFAIFRLFFGAVTSQERTQWCSGVVSHADIPLPEDFLVNPGDYVVVGPRPSTAVGLQKGNLNRSKQSINLALDLGGQIGKPLA